VGPTAAGELPRGPLSPFSPKETRWSRELIIPRSETARRGASAFADGLAALPVDAVATDSESAAAATVLGVTCHDFTGAPAAGVDPAATAEQPKPRGRTRKSTDAAPSGGGGATREGAAGGQGARKPKGTSGGRKGKREV